MSIWANVHKKRGKTSISRTFAIHKLNQPSSPMTTGLFSTAYFAPIQYYWHMNRVDNVVMEMHEHYTKQTWRNRCTIATANGPMTLSLPIEADPSGKGPIRDIRLSDHGNWQHLHWNSIESAYRSSPFFDYYEDDLRPFFEGKTQFLVDFNERIRETMCEMIEIRPLVHASLEYMNEHTLPEGWQDFRTQIHPKKDPQQTGFEATPYYQVFDRKYGFLPNLSILDLVFNMGPETVLYL